MRIEVGCRFDIGMTEELLDGLQVFAFLQKPGRKGVAEAVELYMLYPCFL